MLQQRKKRAPRRGVSSGSSSAATSVSSLTDNPPASDAPPPRPQSKLYSISGLQNERTFAGRFNARGQAYNFVFAPTGAALNEGKLELTGRFSVSTGAAPRGGAARTVDGVRATLLASQGGIGTSPSRRQALAAGTVQSGNIATPQQKQEEAKAPETKQETPEPAKPAPSSLPVTEATDELAFAGVMYFRFSPLDARPLGVPVDLSRVQLNARLAPTSNFERDLQLLYSDVVTATGGNKTDESAATRYVQELDRVLKGASTGAYRPSGVESQSPFDAQSTALTSTQVHPHFEILEAAE